ncbi:hypothetical protein JTB14_005287 [Gonioctena quinquepunctata]|nr:hypothetical protein JTB14_005287 [Gonioctena quinquepunctata]
MYSLAYRLQQPGHPSSHWQRTNPTTGISDRPWCDNEQIVDLVGTYCKYCEKTNIIVRKSFQSPDARLLIQLYERILSYTLSVDLGHIFPLNVDERLRCHSPKLLEVGFITSIRQHFFTNKVFHEWNSLTDNIVLAPSINAFRNRLDNYYNRAVDPVCVSGSVCASSAVWPLFRLAPVQNMCDI